EQRTIPFLALESQLASMTLDNTARNIEAESQARDVGVVMQAFELTENFSMIWSRDSDAVVPDADSSDVVFSGEGDFDFLSVAVLDRVREEVRDDLFDSEAIPVGDDSFLDPEKKFRAGSL